MRKKVMAETIKGLVERITFSSEEDGYSVLKVKVPGRKGLVTAVGNFASVTPGEVLVMEGEWSDHARFGEQFKVERYETSVPATEAGIVKYLGSGLIRGIGPKMAQRIVARFGEQTLDVIEHEIERLLEVEGIGPYRVERISKAWDDQKDIRDLMVFLRGHGVSSAYATRIFKHYGKGALDVVRNNPYRLAMDVSGIGFITADKIAGNLGFAPDSPLRAEAGILYVIQQGMDGGHVCLPFQRLVEDSVKLLDIPPEIIEDALQRLAADRRVVIEDLSVEVAESFGDHRAVYLRGYHLAEVQACRRLIFLQSYGRLQKKIDPEAALQQLRNKLPVKLAPLQEDAVRRTLTDKVVVITGGPGTGKTTLIRAVLTIYRHMGARVCLAAPTGRAAKRLSEATRHVAGTVHRLLEFSPQTGGFQKNEQQPLSADLVIVDEASMLDVLLLHHLLKAVPGHATFVLVGDVDQLPSVGPGNVLRDIIDSGGFPVVRLTEIFRQARKSRIVTNAHLIQQGRFPLIKADPDELQDFYFIEKEDPEAAVQVIIRLCTDRIPARFGFDPMEDIQVLSPMQKGAAGVQRLNAALQEAFNPKGKSVERNGRIYRVGDRVMQIRNNYDKEVFNGDMGRVRKIDLEEQELVVEMDRRPVTYDFSDLDELVPAYAISIHKAQGSEYPAVVIPLLTQHYVMLQRNLLYTAVTRARKLVIVVGTVRALSIAVRNEKMHRRHTLFKERLRGMLQSGCF
jgi:exodeoxyribonuclease V alpha subunit